MSEKSIDKIVKALKFGLFLLPLVPLIVGGSIYGKILLPGAGDLFFPFITGKAFYFRIIVEILFALWVLVASFDKKYRPKSTPVLWAILATVFVLTLSTIFGANPYRSFWSNYERMEGLIGHLHLLAFFLVLTSVFLNHKDWKRFFLVSLGASFLVSSYAYFQSLGLIKVFQSSERVDATIGNSTYLAIYLVFHIFLALYLLLKEDKKWLRYILGFFMAYEIPVVFLTATRGAILGLIGGGFLLALFFGSPAGEFSGNKKLKKLSFGFIGLLLVAIASFWFVKDKSFVQENYVLKRFANMSFSEQTIKSRLSIWKISWMGIKERPILGWGIENYDQVFNKYYTPDLWSNEPWFDRSHDVILDWLIDGGILGLLAYLSIFASGLYMLRKAFSRNEIAVFAVLFGVYFFHNLFVFDNLTSYFLFFSVLGFISFRYNEGVSKYRHIDMSKASISPNQLNFVLPILSFIFIIFALYVVNIKPLLTSNALIKTMKDFSTNGQNTNLILSDFEKVFSYNTFGTGEAREQMVQYTNAALASGLPNADKVKIVEKTIAQLKDHLEKNPKSARIFIMLANIYGQAGLLDDSAATLEKALELSPKKQQFYFLKADIYLNKKDYKKALEILKTAYELEPTYKEAAKNLAIVYIVNGEQDLAENLIKNTYGAPVIADEQLINAYGRIGNWKKVKDIWELFVKRDNGNVQYRVSLAAAHLKFGNREKAIQVLRDAIKISNDFKAQGEALIKEIQAGKNF